MQRRSVVAALQNIEVSAAAGAAAGPAWECLHLKAAQAGCCFMSLGYAQAGGCLHDCHPTESVCPWQAQVQSACAADAEPPAALASTARYDKHLLIRARWSGACPASCAVCTGEYR